jgi:hypothetical protein
MARIVPNAYRNGCITNNQKIGMLTRLFKSSLPFQAVILTTITGLLWLNVFYQPTKLPVFDSYVIQKSLLNAFATDATVSSVMALLALILSALIFNFFITNNDYIPRYTLLPAFLYILFFSHSPGLLFLNPATVPTVLLLLVLINTMKMHDKEDAFVLVFNTSFIAALAAILYPPAMVYLLFIWFSFLVNGILKWREWVISIIGYVIPCLFVLMAYFWFDKLPEFFANHIPVPFINWNVVPVPNTIEIILSVLISILFLSGFRKVLAIQNERVISFRKRTWTMLWFSFFSLLSLLFAGADYWFHLSLLTIPAIAFISYYFLSQRKSLGSEIMVWLLLIIIVLQNTGIL